MTDELAPYFLGPYGENNDFFEKTLTELVRDHVFWRRNFHPEDTPPISTGDQHAPEFQAATAKARQELHLLTAQLKRSVPFFHPRYLGHMVSDLLMPGLIAQLVTTLYNPNNIVEESAPVTVQLELEVGRQLARMLGYPLDPKQVPCALGHLTGGGTVANDEGLWLARAARLYPLAVRDAGLGFSLGDDWELLAAATGCRSSPARRHPRPPRPRTSSPPRPPLPAPTGLQPRCRVRSTRSCQEPTSGASGAA